MRYFTASNLCRLVFNPRLVFIVGIHGQTVYSELCSPALISAVVQTENTNRQARDGHDLIKQANHRAVRSGRAEMPESSWTRLQNPEVEDVDEERQR